MELFPFMASTCQRKLARNPTHTLASAASIWPAQYHCLEINQRDMASAPSQTLNNPSRSLFQSRKHLSWPIKHQMGNPMEPLHPEESLLKLHWPTPTLPVLDSPTTSISSSWLATKSVMAT